MAVTNNNWLNANSTRRYPLDDKATGEADDGTEFPHDIIVDMRLRFPELTAKFAAISSINCTSKIVTITISGCDSYTLSTDEIDPVSIGCSVFAKASNFWGTVCGQAYC